MTRDLVVRIDLRETAFTDSKDVTDYIRDQVRTTETVNTTRVLAVASDLSPGPQAESVTSITTSKLTQRVMVVTVEERDDDPSGLTVDSLLNRSSVRLIWIPDTEGIVWGFGGEVLLPGAEEDEQSLERALDVISEPRVFDRVWEETGVGTVNSLGFKMTSLPAADLDDLYQCEQRGVKRLQGKPTDPMPDLPRELEQLTGNAKPSDNFLARGSDIARAADHIRTNRTIAHQATRRLRVNPLSASSATSAVRAVEEAEAELDRLRHSILDISTTVDGSDGIDRDEAEILHRYGFNTLDSDSLADMEQAAEDSLHDWLRAELPEHGMTAVRKRLEDLYRKLTPRDAESVTAEIDHVCPEIEESRPHRERFRVLLPPEAGAALVMVGATAGLVRPRNYGVTLVALMTVVSVASQFLFRSTVVKRQPIYSHLGELLPWLLLPALGGLTTFADVSLPYPGILAVVAALGLIAALTSSWFNSIDAWTRELHVNGDANLLLDRIRSVGWNEWVLAGPRLRLAAMVEGVIGHLEQGDELLMKLLNEQPPDSEVNIADGGPVLRGRASLAPMIKAVRSELVEALLAGFDDVWRNIGQSDSNTSSPFSERVKQEVASVRSQIYRPLDIDQSGPQSAILSAHHEMQRELSEQSGATTDLPRFSIHSEMRQFVSPDQKRFLEDSAEAVHLVSFVPEDLNIEGFGDAVEVHKPIAGALRLVGYFKHAISWVGASDSPTG